MKVFEKVYLGNKDVAKNLKFMKKNNITHVLNVTTNIKNYFENPSQLTLSSQETNSTQDAQEEENIKKSEEAFRGFHFDEEEEKITNIKSVVESGDDLSLGFGDIMTTDFESSAAMNDEPVDLLKTSFDQFPTLETENIIIPQELEISKPTKEKPIEEIQKKQEKKDEMEESEDEDDIEIEIDQLKPLAYKRIEINDSMEENIKKYFEDGVKFIENAENILVHCREGRCRSVSMILAYSMKNLNMTLKDAYEHISKITNNDTRINDGFKRQLMEYELEIHQHLNGENSLNFFPQRKRVQSYVCEEHYEEEEEGFYLPGEKKKKKKDPALKNNALITSFIFKKPTHSDPNAKPLKGSLMNWLIPKKKVEEKKDETTEEKKFEEEIKPNEKTLVEEKQELKEDKVNVVKEIMDGDNKNIEKKPSKIFTTPKKKKNTSEIKTPKSSTKKEKTPKLREMKSPSKIKKISKENTSPNKKRKRDEEKSDDDQPKTPKKMKSEDENSTSTNGWSPAKKKAHDQLNTNPNAYYYRFNAPDEEQKTGGWSSEEKELFLERLKTFEINGAAQWGIFSTKIPGRCGYQCSNFYRTLVKKGEIKDSNYTVDEKGQLHFQFKNKKKKQEE